MPQIRDGDTVVIGGFAGISSAEYLVVALENRFLQTGQPRRPSSGGDTG